MPVMGGEEAASILCQEKSKIPLVALTANVMQHQINNYREVGFIDVIAKPFDRQHLLQVLKKFLPEKLSALSGNVLIAEDNPVNLKLLTRQVEKIGSDINVTAVKNGALAVETYNSTPFDLVFLDMEMPVMSGIEALINMRDNGCNAPIYMVTGNTSPEDIRYCSKMGASGHISKPIDRQILQKVCFEHLK